MEAKKDISKDQERADGNRAVMASAILEVVYTWPNGREEVRYRRPWHSKDGEAMRQEVDHLRACAEAKGLKPEYSYRAVDGA